MRVQDVMTSGVKTISPATSRRGLERNALQPHSSTTSVNALARGECEHCARCAPAAPFLAADLK